MEPVDHIAVVDDDPSIRELLAEQLTRQGFRVSAVASGRTLRAVLAQTPVDLIVLDVMMPGEDGLAVLQSLRQGEHAATPILLLTALGEDVDRIIGLEMGADDYMPKPFTPRELVARIRAVLRRARMLPPGQASAQRLRFVRFGEWQLDGVERLLLDPQGMAVPLNGAEFNLLRFLVEHAQRIVTRDQLLVHLAGRDADVFDRSIDLRVSRLRKRFEQGGHSGKFIKTVYGAGYLLAATVGWS